jgi:hypothetical protein
MSRRIFSCKFFLLYPDGHTEGRANDEDSFDVVCGTCGHFISGRGGVASFPYPGLVIAHAATGEAAAILSRDTAC